MPGNNGYPAPIDRTGIPITSLPENYTFNNTFFKKYRLIRRIYIVRCRHGCYAASVQKMLPGGINVLKGYKIHEDQVANVARDLKEYYHTRRLDSQPSGCYGMGDGKQKNEKAGSVPCRQVRKTIWKTSPMDEPLNDDKNALLPKIETPDPTVTAIHCFRCGIDFPVADFFYTQKSGLCIDCWEKIVV